MTIDDVLQLVRAKLQKDLNPIQERLLREVWNGEKYSNIASASHYGEHYLRNAASSLWQLLSGIFNTSITKANFRPILESRPLTSEEQQLIQDFIRRQAVANPLEFPSGPLPVSSVFYIDRPPIEELAYQEIAKAGSMIRVKAPRKMGKSSLMLRILDRAHSLGLRCCALMLLYLEDVSFLQRLSHFIEDILLVKFPEDKIIYRRIWLLHSNTVRRKLA